MRKRAQRNLPGGRTVFSGILLEAGARTEFSGTLSDALHKVKFVLLSRAGAHNENSIYFISSPLPVKSSS